MKKLLLGFGLILFSLWTFGQSASSNFNLLKQIKSFSETSSVTGREEEAITYIQSLFPNGKFKKDKLGNLSMVLGSGEPRILLTAPLDEPGYVISSIQDKGYLKISPVGSGFSGNMYHQFLEGNEVKIGTENFPCKGIAIVPSLHYEGLRAIPEKSKGVYSWQETIIDVGANSAAEVEEKGIHLLDPLTLNKKPIIIAEKYISAPSAKSKSAVIALAHVAKILSSSGVKGTVVIAFSTLDLINGMGLEDVVQNLGPFQKIYRFNRFLNSPIKDKPSLLADREFIGNSNNIILTKPFLKGRSWPDQPTDNPVWQKTEVYNIGLPSNYSYTPVEMVDVSDVQKLIQTWLMVFEKSPQEIDYLSISHNSSKGPIYTSFKKEEGWLTKLVSLYGVSEKETSVHDFIQSNLPVWAKPKTDPKGNLIINFGHGKQEIVFVAHMDEVGYRVDSILADGRLILRQMGGFFNSIWEGHGALIHVEGKDITGIFEPRANYMTTNARTNGLLTPIVYAGFVNRTQALQAGIEEGKTSVTMPKAMIRLSETKATARGFDDRAGCASLLMAIKEIDPEKLPFTITCIWSVEEETGLVGSTYASKDFPKAAIVYPIDTFVSSDDPVDPRIFGYCPLGQGAVVRVLESTNFVTRKDLHYLQNLARKNFIQIQYGMTAGGTDGLGFLKNDIRSVPISWPGRYSHSPVEVLDFRDLHNLTLLEEAIMKDNTKIY